ncbi:leucyl aminopeptidase [Alphaproteobacteria bacterium]|nr:leucyl aminopeptidase [Alphaproteobacteria bacterium]
MNIKFNSLNRRNQSIILIVDISNKFIRNKKLQSFKYNNHEIFKYSFFIINSKLNISISNISDSKGFYLKLIGSFIYDQSIKYSISDLTINCKDLNLLENIIFGFSQKNFIYTVHKKNSNLKNFKTSYKLSKNNTHLINSINYLKQLVSEPSNIIYPDTFVKIAQKNFNKKNMNVRILKEDKIKKIGLNCLLAVSQGSARKPRVMEFYNKKSPKNVDILFVGKGVCFDSGGISIKPSAGMEDMKWDMGGAAVTAAIMKYFSEINPNISYAGIVGLVENMPSSTAYKPGDIIKSYKGINVEVLNTDAEGRLVLADIITYGCEVYNPKIVIDFATLTGAIVVALGQHYAGLYSNDDTIAKKLYDSSINTNEKVWRMPLHDDFDKELNSPFVDLKNIGAGRYGGSITAAQFLQRFIPPKTKWAHLDIAGTTWKNSGDLMNSKGATGFGLTLIADFIDTYFKK